MNRTDFQRLATLRIAEAQALLAAGFPAGAYYLAGYAVECAIKTCIAKNVQQYDFPDKDRVNQSYSHNLVQLLRAANLEDEFGNARSKQPRTRRLLEGCERLERIRPIRRDRYYHESQQPDNGDY